MFARKASKGIKGVFSGKDVEKYLQEIERLERAVKARDLAIARLDTQLAGISKEVASLRKQALKQDLTIQEQRNELASTRVALDELQTNHDALQGEKTAAIDTLKRELERAAPRHEFDAIKAACGRLEGTVADLRGQLARRDDQVRRLTEENLKLKDRLKFLKEEGA